MFNKPLTCIAALLSVTLLSSIPVAAQETNPPENTIVTAPSQEITRELLKSFVVDELHHNVDYLIDEALSYLEPLMREIITIENDRHRRIVASGVIAVFLAPRTDAFDHAIKRFDRVGIEVDETDILLARAYLGAEGDRIAAENALVKRDMAAQVEIIARQRAEIVELNRRIAELQAQSAEYQAQIERLDRMKEDILGIISAIEERSGQ